MILPSDETELSTKGQPDEENSLSTKESFTGIIGVTIGDLDKYKKDSLINIWKDANAYYSSGEEWTDEDAEFFDELAVRINTATEEGMGSISGPAVGMIANNNKEEKETMVMPSESKEEFKEDDHPRDGGGQFTSGSGGSDPETDEWSGNPDTNPFKDKNIKDIIKSIKGGSKNWQDWKFAEHIPEMAEIEKRNKELPKPEKPEGYTNEKIFRDDPDAVSKTELKVKYLENVADYWKQVTKFPVRDFGNNLGHSSLGDQKWYAMSNNSQLLNGTRKKLEQIKNQGTLTRNTTYKSNQYGKSKPRFYYTEEPKGESLEQIKLNESYIQDQFGVFYRPVYVGENYKEHGTDLVFEGKLYTTEGVGNCPFCKGAGKVTVEKLGLKDCPDCEGSGDVQGEQEMPPQEMPPQMEEPTDVFGKISPKPKKESKEHYDKDGTYWFTTDGGRKIGVKKGQSLEDALSASGIPDDGVDQSDVTAEDMAKNEDKSKDNDKPKKDKQTSEVPEDIDDDEQGDNVDEPKEDKKADGKTSMGMKDIDIRDRNIGMSSNDSGGLDLSLNQDGWSWSGDETDLIDYVSRIASSSKSDEFIEQLKDVPFDKLKEQMVKNIEDNPDAFYSLSGDSRRWKFGETEDGDMDYMIDEEISQTEEELTDEQIQEVKDTVWDNYTDGSYEEFMESWHGKELKDQFTEALEESDSLEELFGKFNDDTGLKYDSIVAQSGYDDDLKFNVIRETIQNVLGKKDSNEDDSDDTRPISGDGKRMGISSKEWEENGYKVDFDNMGGISITKDGEDVWYSQSNDDNNDMFGEDPDEQKVLNTLESGGAITFESKKDSGESLSTESCGCKKKGLEASISKYEKFVRTEINILKKRANEGESVGLMYGLPTVRKDGKKIKGTLAYAGVSLNDRIYLPEELAKGHGKTLPLLLNHSSTAGAEEELDRLDSEMRDHLENEKDYEVGEVTLTWDADKLTLFYEGVIENEFFQKEVDDMDMAVSLGIFYDSNSPKVCDENCYTLIKGAEFREVSLVYHAGFPIATIEAVEAKLKRASLKDIKAKSSEDYLGNSGGSGHGYGEQLPESIAKHYENNRWSGHDGLVDYYATCKICGKEISAFSLNKYGIHLVEEHGITESKANEDSLIKVEDKNDDDTKVTVLDEWKSKGEAIAEEEEDELPLGGSIDAEPKETDTIEQPMMKEVRSSNDFSVRGVSGMTISNSNGVEKYTFDPTNSYSTNMIHFSVTEQGGVISGEEIQMQPKMATPEELTKEIESHPNVVFTDPDENILKKN